MKTNAIKRRGWRLPSFCNIQKSVLCVLGRTEGTGWTAELCIPAWENHWQHDPSPCILSSPLPFSTSRKIDAYHISATLQPLMWHLDNTHIYKWTERDVSPYFLRNAHLQCSYYLYPVAGQLAFLCWGMRLFKSSLSLSVKWRWWWEVSRMTVGGQNGIMCVNGLVWRLVWLQH